MGYALKVEIEMREMVCGECGINFAAPELIMAKRQETGEGWYCPNGHSRVYRESDADKLRKQLAAEQSRVALERSMRITAEEQLDKAKKEAKRVAKRIAAGICPHCHRTFQQLARHMQCKHSAELG